MTEYLIGDTIVATAITSAGEGQSIVEYEWQLGTFVYNVERTSPFIVINTSAKTEGSETLSLKVLNDCGAWSTIYTENITYVEPIGNISISNCCTFKQGDTISINYNGLNFDNNGTIILVDTNNAIKQTWNIAGTSGSVAYSTNTTEPLGTWYAYILYKNQPLATAASYIEFELTDFCPIPTASFALE